MQTDDRPVKIDRAPGDAYDFDYTFDRPLSTYVAPDAEARLALLRARLGDRRPDEAR